MLAVLHDTVLRGYLPQYGPLLSYLSRVSWNLHAVINERHARGSLENALPAFSKIYLALPHGPPPSCHYSASCNRTVTKQYTRAELSKLRLVKGSRSYPTSSNYNRFKQQESEVLIATQGTNTMRYSGQGRRERQLNFPTFSCM